MYYLCLSEIDETFKRIQSHKGVVGIIVLNMDGIPIKSSMDSNTTIEYAGLITHLLDKARQTVKELDNTNELTFLRIRTKKNELLIAPDKEYMMIVIQNPNE
nr:dynein light chain roadblock-type 2 isoform X2 [Parasteatoda tepidariorum]